MPASKYPLLAQILFRPLFVIYVIEVSAAIDGNKLHSS